MTRILSIDYGKKRIGLAITDERRIMALPLETISTGKSHQESVKNLAKATSQYSILEIVLGLPLLPNGQESPMSVEVRAFAKTLEAQTKWPVEFFDERFTSIRAHQELASFSRKKRTPKLDETSALILLQDYLEKKRLETS
ncbi:MAG: Holliday junction resolvase RuvX [Chlamydiota bacterium]